MSGEFRTAATLIACALALCGAPSCSDSSKAELRDAVRSRALSLVRAWMTHQSGPLTELWGDMCDVVRETPEGYVAGLGFDAGIFTAKRNVPTLVRKIRIGGFVHDIAVEPPYVFMAAGGAGLAILNLESPRSIRRYSPPEPGYALAFRSQGGVGYLGMKDGGGLLVLDVSDPKHPHELGRIFAGEDVSDIEIRDGTLAVAVSGRVEFMSLSAGGVPSPRASLSLPIPQGIRPIDPLPRDLDFDGSLLAVANGEDGLRLFDVASHTAPRPLGHITNRGFMDSVVLSDARAYVGRKGLAIGIVDISNRLKPVWVGELATTGRTLRGATPREMIVARWAKGFAQYRIGRDGLEAVTSFSPAPRFHDVTAAKGFVYASATGQGIIAYADRGDRLVEVGGMQTPGYVHRARIVGNSLWIADTIGGFLIADLDDPAHPRTVEHLNVGNHVWAAIPTERGIVMADGQHGLSVFKPAYPGWTRESELFLDGYAVDIASKGLHLYLATIGVGIPVIRLDAAGLTWVNTVRPFRFIPKPFVALAVVGNRLVVGDLKGTLSVYSLDDPSSPRFLAKSSVGGSVFDIESDGDDVLWLALHRRGAARVRMEESGKVHDIQRFWSGETVYGVGLGDSDLLGATADGKILRVLRGANP